MVQIRLYGATPYPQWLSNSASGEPDRFASREAAERQIPGIRMLMGEHVRVVAVPLGEGQRC